MRHWIIFILALPMLLIACGLHMSTPEAKSVFVPKGTGPVKGIELVQVGQVNEVLAALFG